MEKVQWNLINKKQNGPEQSKKCKIIHPTRALHVQMSTDFYI